MIVLDPGSTRSELVLGQATPVRTEMYQEFGATKEFQ